MIKIALGICIVMWSIGVGAEPLNVPIGVTELSENDTKIRLTRTHIPNITAHRYDIFMLEILRDNKWQKIPVDNFNTMEGADCFVQDFDFYTNPFRIVQKRRAFGEAWMDVQPITITIYELTDEGKLIKTGEHIYPPACDVRDINTQNLI